MIHDIENIKIGKNRLINGKLVYRRGDDLFLVDGENYNAEGLIKLFGLKDQKQEIVTLATAETSKSKTAVAMVEPPSRVLSYHLCSNELELACYKLAAIARKILVYYTSTHIKDGKYYADQPWMIDWDTLPGQGKEFIRVTSEKFKDSQIKCPFCGSEHNKLNSYVSHVVSSHSYVKDKKPVKEPVKEHKLEQQEVKQEPAADIQETDFPCPYCDKVLKSSSGRTNHIKSTHPGKQ